MDGVAVITAGMLTNAATTAASITRVIEVVITIAIAKCR
jgi:hypothetical protein